MSAPVEVAFTERGYLHLSAEVTARFFPNGLLIALVRDNELWLLPTRGAAGGGLILKQRNAAGDRSVLIWEVLPQHPVGTRPALWDQVQGALRVALVGETLPAAAR